METAADIVCATVRAATPDAPPLIRDVTRAVFTGRRPRMISAEVVLFDGLPAKLRLERWAQGWGFGWDDMPFDFYEWLEMHMEAEDALR